MPVTLVSPAEIYSGNSIRIWHSGLIAGEARTYLGVIIESLELNDKVFPLSPGMIRDIQKSISVAFSQDGETLPYRMISGGQDMAAMTWVSAFPSLDVGRYTMHIDISPLVHHNTTFDVA